MEEIETEREERVKMGSEEEGAEGDGALFSQREVAGDAVAS